MMKFLDKLVEWWNSQNKERFDNDVKNYIKRNYSVEERDWNRISEEDKEEWREFYRKELER